MEKLTLSSITGRMSPCKTDSYSALTKCMTVVDCVAGIVGGEGAMSLSTRGVLVKFLSL